jgi:ABC-type transporter Mla subunit MlaD
MNIIYKKAMDISSKLDRNLDAMEKLLSNSNSLVEENRPAIHETVANLKDISSEAKSLAADLKAHPWKLFWKGKEKKETSREEGKQPARQKFLGIF